MLLKIGLESSLLILINTFHAFRMVAKKNIKIEEMPMIQIKRFAIVASINQEKRNKNKKERSLIKKNIMLSESLKMKITTLKSSVQIVIYINGLQRHNLTLNLINFAKSVIILITIKMIKIRFYLEEC